MKKVIIIFIVITFNIYTFAQNQSEYEEKLSQYINYLENAPNADTINLETVFLISKKGKLRKAYIDELNTQIYSINLRINRLQTYIKDIERKLKKTKQIYSQMLVFTYLYKNYFPSNLIFILSSKTFNQAYMRLKFLELSTKYLKSLTKLISLTKKELEYQKTILQQSIQLRQKLIAKISHQQSLLQEEYDMLNKIKENSQEYQHLLAELKTYELVRKSLNQKIEKEINIEKEENKDISNISTLFAKSKGALPPPLDNAIIVIPFGVHQHPQLKTVKVRNDGIDITSKQDSTVKAVFDGIVTNIITLPNGYYAILIKHGEYFTVYSNIAKVLVKQDTPVKTGEKIGLIKPKKGEKLPVLNFQIWHLSEKLNPEYWINI